MFDFLNKHRRYILSRHNIPATQADAQGTISVSSVVIPCTGADYIEEAVLSAYFASRCADTISEIVIVSDQPSRFSAAAGTRACGDAGGAVS